MLRRVVLVVLLFTAVACAGDAKEYGATEAGPTKRAQPLVADKAPPAEEPGQKVVTTSAGLCELYTPAEIEERLGLPVHEGKPVAGKSYASCRWLGVGMPAEAKGVRPVPTVVSITRGKAGQYADYRASITAVAEQRSASGGQDLRGVGDEAYAIGASVKGIPIWYGGARHEDWMTAVEMSGGGSKAGVASVTELLLDIIERG
jgi:hypothetical protein